MPPGKKPTKDYHYSVWVTEEQRTDIDAASVLAGEEHASTWLRKLAVREAKELLATVNGKKKPR